jgi:hypothetical protein
VDGAVAHDRGPGAGLQHPASALDVIARLVAAYAPGPGIHSVAVVANAPLEPDPERAAAIDACDLVLRCNSFVLDEPDGPATVGSRVDVVVFNRLLRAAPRVFDSYRDRLYLMVEPGALHRTSNYRPPRWPADLGHLVVPNREFTLPLSEALGLATRQEAVWATTGLLSVWIAMTLFPDAELRIAGFSMIEDRTQVEWSHAWGDSCAVGPEHRIEPEGRLLADWVRSGRVVLLR